MSLGASTSPIRCVRRSIPRYVRRRVSGTQHARRQCGTSRERTHRGYEWAGKMYEVRISNIARYMTDHDASAPLTADGHTIALYRFDEGSGDVLNDSSGNRHHGKIVGAKWVKTKGSMISPPAAAQTRLPSNASPSAAARKSGLSRHAGATTRPREIPRGVCRAGTCNTLRPWLGSSSRS